MNPAAVAQRLREESMEALRTEVETLKKRNQILEEQGGGHVNDLTVQVEEKMAQPSPSKELEGGQLCLCFSQSISLLISY